jgi:hypothetical protein
MTYFHTFQKRVLKQSSEQHYLNSCFINFAIIICIYSDWLGTTTASANYCDPYSTEIIYKVQLLHTHNKQYLDNSHYRKSRNNMPKELGRQNRLFLMLF